MSRIVLIDDEEDMLAIVGDYLRSQGHTVLTSVEGTEGLRLLLENAPDLVILDIQVPGMSGLKILKEARKSLPSLKAIVLTGYGSSPEFEKEAEASGALFLRKPIGLEELDQAVSKVLAPSG
ncbi:MAG: response regulator [Candidatus Omnitrophica bacterium]|nr:response regulator [Candidatus Omnitrophota bacterium]